MIRRRPRIDRVLPKAPARAEEPDTLNLADLDPAVWYVMGQGKAHGPFTFGQLQSLADAGRLGPLARISGGDGEPFVPALEHPVLRPRIQAALEARAARRAEATNFVLICGPGVSESDRQAVAEALTALGRATEPMPGTFILRSAYVLGDVRRAIASLLPPTAQLMIFESRDARLGWTGLPLPQTESLRTTWNAPLSENL
ncbi:MAG TPA: hypothetical protein PKV67_11650 [Hyphomonas sp.]|nr:hypothetical protein [Hyphomonas sp.]